MKGCEWLVTNSLEVSCKRELTKVDSLPDWFYFSLTWVTVFSIALENNLKKNW